LTRKKRAEEITLAKEQTDWITASTVYEDYGFSTSTLAKWRMDNKNLKFSKMGKYIRYKRSDIEEFIQSNMVDVVS